MAQGEENDHNPDFKQALYERLIVQATPAWIWITAILLIFLISYFLSVHIAESLKPSEIMLSTLSLAIVSIFIVLLAAFLGVYTILLPKLIESVQPPAPSLGPRPHDQEQPVQRTVIVESAQVTPPVASGSFSNEYQLLQILQNIRSPLVILTSVTLMLGILLAYLNHPLSLEDNKYYSTFLSTLIVGFAILSGWCFIHLVVDVVRITDRMLEQKIAVGRV